MNSTIFDVVEIKITSVTYQHDLRVYRQLSCTGLGYSVWGWLVAHFLQNVLMVTY